MEDLSVLDSDGKKTPASEMELKDQADPTGAILEGVDTALLESGIYLEAPQTNHIDLASLLAMVCPSDYMTEAARRLTEEYRALLVSDDDWPGDEMRKEWAAWSKIRERTMELNLERALKDGFITRSHPYGCNSCKGPCYCAPPNPTPQARLVSWLKKRGVGMYGVPRTGPVMSDPHADYVDDIQLVHDVWLDRSWLRCLGDVLLRVSIGVSSRQSSGEFLTSQGTYGEDSVEETGGVIQNRKALARAEGRMMVAKKGLEAIDEAVGGLNRIHIKVWVNTLTKRHGMLMWADGGRYQKRPVPRDHAMEVLQNWGIR